VPPAPYRGRFSKAAGSASSSGEINIGALHDEMPTFAPEQLDAMRDAYDESLLSLDAGIGDLLDALRRRGVLDDTIVVVTSDHGESFGEQGMVWHGHSLHVEQIKVPLIVRFPRAVPAGVRDRTPVDLSRLAASVASLADLSGSPFGDARFPVAGGTSAASDAVAEAGVARRSQVPGPWPTSRASLSALVSERFLLVLEDGRPAELFDLAGDRKGLINVVGLPEHAEVIESLRARASGGW
jgi:arylsulfatase A-like enzyme